MHSSPFNMEYNLKQQLDLANMTIAKLEAEEVNKFSEKLEVIYYYCI